MYDRRHDTKWKDIRKPGIETTANIVGTCHLREIRISRDTALGPNILHRSRQLTTPYCQGCRPSARTLRSAATKFEHCISTTYEDLYTTGDANVDKSPLPLTDPRDAVPFAHRSVHMYRRWRWSDDGHQFITLNVHIIESTWDGQPFHRYGWCPPKLKWFTWHNHAP